MCTVKVLCKFDCSFDVQFFLSTYNFTQKVKITLIAGTSTCKNLKYDILLLIIDVFHILEIIFNFTVSVINPTKNRNSFYSLFSLRCKSVKLKAQYTLRSEGTRSRDTTQRQGAKWGLKINCIFSTFITVRIFSSTSCIHQDVFTSVSKDCLGGYIHDLHLNNFY